MTALSQAMAQPVGRRSKDHARLRQMAAQARHKARQPSHEARRPAVDADERLARLRQIRVARDAAERRRERLRRLANPIRLVLVSSFLFYLGLAGLYFVSEARDWL
jgi:hypothetical protein